MKPAASVARRCPPTLAWLCVLVFCLPEPVCATCTISVGSLAFADYHPFSTSNDDATATISLTCDTSGSYTIALSWGNSNGAGGQRWMLNSTSKLFYALYTDSGRSNFWTDTPVAVNYGSQIVQIPIYGRIPLGQTTVAPGTYGDSIFVTVTF